MEQNVEPSNANALSVLQTEECNLQRKMRRLNILSLKSRNIENEKTRIRGRLREIGATVRTLQSKVDMERNEAKF